MRNLIILLSVFALVSCKDLEIKQYEYHTTTQMGRTVLTVTQDSVIVTFNGRTAPTRFSRATQTSEWEALNASMSDVDLSKVSTLEAPSNKRATDASPFAKIVFVGNDSTVTSADFDAKNPHEMLKPVEKQFLEIQEENKR